MSQAGILLTVILWGVVCFGFTLAFYLIEAFGVYKMSQTLRLARPWLAFIPVAQDYQLGRVAECNPFGRRMKFSRILLILKIVVMAMLVPLLILMFVLIGSRMEYYQYGFGYGYGSIYGSYARSGAAFALLYGLFMLLTSAASIVYAVFAYIARWRIFKLFDPNNATAYLILSIFISVTEPIFMLLMGKKQPVFSAPQPPYGYPQNPYGRPPYNGQPYGYQPYNGQPAQQGTQPPENQNPPQNPGQPQ